VNPSLTFYTADLSPQHAVYVSHISPLLLDPSYVVADIWRTTLFVVTVVALAAAFAAQHHFHSSSNPRTVLKQALIPIVRAVIQAQQS